MKPLIAIFCPPLYFAMQGRFVAAAIHFVVWCIAILTALLVIGVLIWAVQASVATWDLRKQLQEEQATAIATKMAEVMQNQNQSGGNSQ
jgi:hypothetical protein